MKCLLTRKELDSKGGCEQSGENDSECDAIKVYPTCVEILKGKNDALEKRLELSDAMTCENCNMEARLENAQLRTALEFYGCEENYDEYDSLNSATTIMDDGGATAREALDKILKKERPDEIHG
jgi:hypothetical protein